MDNEGGVQKLFSRPRRNYREVAQLLLVGFSKDDELTL